MDMDIIGPIVFVICLFSMPSYGKITFNNAETNSVHVDQKQDYKTVRPPPPDIPDNLGEPPSEEPSTVSEDLGLHEEKTDCPPKASHHNYGDRWRNFSRAGAGIWLGVSLLCLIVFLVLIGAVMTLFSNNNTRRCFVGTRIHNIQTIEVESQRDTDANSVEIEDLASDPPMYTDHTKSGDYPYRLMFKGISGSQNPLVSSISKCDTTRQVLSNSRNQTVGHGNQAIFSCSQPPSYQQVVNESIVRSCPNLADSDIPPPSYSELHRQGVLPKLAFQ